jgi:hypothetical protein
MDVRIHESGVVLSRLEFFWTEARTRLRALSTKGLLKFEHQDQRRQALDIADLAAQLATPIPSPIAAHSFNSRTSVTVRSESRNMHFFPKLVRFRL